MKLLNLRVDTLSQILTMTNVHSGGRYLVYETGAQGLVVASVLERVGGRGSVTHIYQTGQPQTAWPPWTSLPRFSATSTS